MEIDTGGETMRLEISNFAKIGHADLKFDGITVIAGENNTGKTTVGKILYCIFNSLCDLESQINRRREYEIRQTCLRYLRHPMVMSTKISNIKKENSRLTSRAYDEICTSIAAEICNVYPDEFSVELLTIIITNAFELNDLVVSEQLDGLIEELYEKLKSVVNMDRFRVAHELVFQFFDTNFASQIQSLSTGNDEARIDLFIKNNPVSIALKSDEIGIEGNVNILHEAYFIDDPFVIDDLRSQTLYLGGGSRSYLRPRDFLVNKLRNYDDLPGSIFDTVNAKDKISQIMQIINDVVPGEISSKSGKWSLSSEFFDKPIDFYNLSAGLKSFVLLKMLLERGYLKEKDVLILDEPEIHLHPEWQLKYAEIIVLLQKLFDLSIVVTTHSRDFFEALELYSQKHKISENCNFYLAKQSNGVSTFEDVTTDTTKIYRQLVKPSRLLDNLKFELEDSEDE